MINNEINKPSHKYFSDVSYLKLSVREWKQGSLLAYILNFGASVNLQFLFWLFDESLNIHDNFCKMLRGLNSTFHTSENPKQFKLRIFLAYKWDNFFMSYHKQNIKNH